MIRKKKEGKEDIKSLIVLERKLAKVQDDFKLSNSKYKNALEKINSLEREMAGVLKITRKFQVKKIVPKKRTVNGDAVAVEEEQPVG